MSTTTSRTCLPPPIISKIRIFLSKKFFPTPNTSFHYSWLMNTPVFYTISKLKIFYSIVCSVSIYMMYNFFRNKIPANFLLHYKSMLENTTIYGMRMVRGIFNDISVSMLSYPTFPLRIHITSFVVAFYATMYRGFSFTKSSWATVKNFITSWTNKFECKFMFIFDFHRYIIHPIIKMSNAN